MYSIHITIPIPLIDSQFLSSFLSDSWNTWIDFVITTIFNWVERFIQFLYGFVLQIWYRRQDLLIDGNRRHIASNDEVASSIISGVIILWHHRQIGQMKRQSCLHDRVVGIDFKIKYKIIRIILVYLPPGGCHVSLLET